MVHKSILFRVCCVCICALCLCSTTKISTKIIVNAIENEIDFLLPIRIIFRALFSFIVIFIIMIIIVLRLRASKMIFRTHKLQARPTKRRGDDLVGPSKTYATWERLINRQLHTHTHIYTRTSTIPTYILCVAACLANTLSSFKWMHALKKIYFSRLRSRPNYLELLTDFPCRNNQTKRKIEEERKRVREKKKLALKSWWAEIQSQSDWVNLCRHNMLYDYVTNLANKYKVFFGAQNRFENIWWKW